MTQKFSNAARAELAATINSSDATLTIVSGGDLFPVANTGNVTINAGADWFKAVLQDEDGIEIIYVRTHAVASDTFSDILRGQEGTAARDFLAGSIVGLRPLASDAEAWTNRRVSNTSSTGSMVTPSGSSAQRDPSPSAGYLRYNSDLGEIEAYLGGTWRSIGASGMIQSVVEFEAQNGDTTITTGYTPGLVDVYRNGARQGSADVTATSGTVIVFTSALSYGDRVAVVKYSAATIANAVAKSGDTMSGHLNVPAGASGNQAPRAVEVARLAIANTFSQLQSFSGGASAKFVHFNGGYYNAGNSGSAKTINFANGQKQVLTLTANCTVTLTAPGPGNYQILLAQDATGGRTVTWAAQGGIVAFVGSSAAPDIHTAATGYTMVSLFFDGVTNGNAWLAAAKVNA